MNFQATIKFVIASARLILTKVGVDGFNVPRQENDVRSKMIFISHQRYKGGDRDYCCDFLVTFETTSKLLIAFVTLILVKVGVDGFAGPRGEIDIRYEFNLKVILKDLGFK